MFLQNLKRFFVGTPLETRRLLHERLPKWKALAVFSSDALSSVAYATQEILIPLALVGAIATSWSIPVALAITTLLVIVTASYWQTIRCYPSGGGAYIVARENLGTNPALVAAASLLIDYVLTVAVSVAAGVEAITSAFPNLYEHSVGLGIIAVCVVTLVNLRGIRESGTVFAIPTYLFIFSFAVMFICGLYGLWTGTLTPTAPVFHNLYPEVGIFLILRAFSSGCTALTGLEAISNGVPAFRPPESRNARITMLMMALILAVFFLGITSFSHIFQILPAEKETVVSLIAKQIFGDSFFYFVIQGATAAILLLAANTSFADFPRVCSILAVDRFLPRQLAGLGDRLVFSKGIVTLGVVSCFLLYLFGGRTHHLIPLYAVGVFLSFTLSQLGMVRYHWREREKGWSLSLVINALGAIATFVVLVVIGVTKFIHGAWVVVVLIPILSMWFRTTREHYRKAAVQLAISEDINLGEPIRHVVVLPISGIHRGVIDAIKYAKSISREVIAVSVELDPSQTERLKAAWQKLNPGFELVVLQSPYRSIIQPIIKFIREVDRKADDDMLTVVIPEFVTARWWESIYHNQTAFLIRTALMWEKGKVVTSVRYHLSR